MKVTPLILTSLLVSLHTVPSWTYRRVCYYTNWSQYRQGRGKFLPEDVPASLCSHVVYAFASMEGHRLAPFEWNDEDTPWRKGMYTRFNALKNNQPGLKTLLGVGGWTFGTSRMTAMLESKSNRHLFISTAITFLRKRGFDGLDLDFEYPASRGSPPEDKDRYAQLVQEMQTAFHQESLASGRNKLLLTAAVSAGKSKIDSGYDVPVIAKYLDFINLMSYDFHGKWEKKTGHNSPLFAHDSDRGDSRFLNLAFAATYWVKKGVPPSSLNIGLALYGRTFTLADSAHSAVGAAVSGAGRAGRFTAEPGYMAYYEICEHLHGGPTVHWLADQQVPYVVDGDQWIGYDNERSLALKVQWIKEQGFGGIMVWALDLDDFSNSCGGGAFPLLTSINVALLPTGARPATGLRVNLKMTAANRRQGGNMSNRRQYPGYERVFGVETIHAPTFHTWKGSQRLPGSKAHESIKSAVDNSAGPCRARPDGYYADGGDCRRFYRCLGHRTQRRICLRGWHFNAARRVCTLGNCAVYPDYGSSVDSSRNSNSKRSGGNMISPKYIKNSDLIWEGSGDSGDDFIPGLVGPDGNFLLEKPKMASAAGEEQGDGQEATSLAVSAKRGQSAQVDAGFDNELSYDEFFSDDPRKVSYTYNEEDSLDIEDQLLVDYLVYNLGVLPVQ